jgi:sugar O-acyltransferase (sialic acid O-acetyltransferase NeuD family)
MGAPRLLGRIVVPLLSPNEPESQVVTVDVESWSQVRRGDVVCAVETSKASADLESMWDGYTGLISVRVGDRVDAGQVICEVFDQLPERRDPPREEVDGEAQLHNLRLTRRAARLAVDAGVDLSLLPADRFVTEADVRALIGAPNTGTALDELAVSERSLVIFGAGGHAKSVIDLVRSSTGYEPLCVADDNPRVAEVLGVPVVASSALAFLHEQGVRWAANAVGAIGRLQTRIDVGRRLEAFGFELPVLVDKTAFVAESASLSGGAQVFARAAVCSAAEVGASAIVNTGAVVSHDCIVGAYAHLAPGALLAGAVEIGEATLVGMGATVTLGARIGARSIVGNGAAVTKDVPERTMVRANTLWPAPAEG